MGKSIAFDLTAPAIIAHPNLLEAKAFKRDGKETGPPKFSVSFVMAPDHPDLAGLKKSALEAAKAEWPGRDIGDAFKKGDIVFPWKSGDKLIERQTAQLKKKGKTYDGKGDFMKGKVVVKASSKFQPGLAVVAGGRIVDLDTPELIAKHKGQFYFGVQALGSLNFQAYDAVKDGDKDGVTAYIQLVLSTGKGEKLAGGASAAERFKGYQGGLSADDPTAGMPDMDLNDDIPY